MTSKNRDRSADYRPPARPNLDARGRLVLQIICSADVADLERALLLANRLARPDEEASLSASRSVRCLVLVVLEARVRPGDDLRDWAANHAEELRVNGELLKLWKAALWAELEAAPGGLFGFHPETEGLRCALAAAR